MCTQTAEKCERAFSVIELLVVIAVFVMLAILLMNSVGNGIKAADMRIICMNNLKQNSIGFASFAKENSNCLPWQISVTNGGAMESSIQGNVSQTFRLLSARGFKPIAFVCPADSSRKIPDLHAALADQNVSYFLNLDSATNNPARIFLSGDRNLQANGFPVKPSLFNASTKVDLNWTREMHRTGGNLAFADGHVEFCGKDRLNEKIRDQGLPGVPLGGSLILQFAATPT